MECDGISAREQAREYDGRLSEQIRINEEMAARSKADARPGDTRLAFYAILAIIFFKPVVEYGIDVWAYLASLFDRASSALAF